MFLRIAQFALWVPCVALQLVIAIQMMRKRSYTEFPAFFSYIAVHVVRTVLLYTFYRLQLSIPYFVGYWLGEAVDIALGVAVIYELYSHAFRRYEALHQLTAMMFRWAAGILVLVAVVSAAGAPGADSDRMMSGLIVLGRSAAIVKVGLLLFLFTFASYFRLTWRHYVLGIAVGLGLFVTVDLAAIAVRAQMGSIGTATYSLVKSAAYNCSVLIWMFYFFSRERSFRSIEPPPKSDLACWNEALIGLLSR